MKHFIGLDVSMKTTFICVVNENGKIIYEGSEKTDPQSLIKHIQSLSVPVGLVAMESGSLSHYLCKALEEEGYPIVCVDSRKMAAILSLRVNKTDKNDARGIAEALRAGMYTKVQQKPQTCVDRGILLSAKLWSIKGPS